MAFCNNGEFIVAKVGNSFCNFVLFHYATNTNVNKNDKEMKSDIEIKEIDMI